MKAFSSTKNSNSPFTHNDIVWKIQPIPETSLLEKLKWRKSANLLRLDYLRKGVEPPLIVCPPGEQLLLEALKNGKRVGRFGITCRPGPMVPLIKRAVQQLFEAESAAGQGVAAIIYMFVEPDFRGEAIGELALDVIAAIHASVGCSYTLLVADDKSDSGTLVKWYERNGFCTAPTLQDMMGSPQGSVGISMIAPTKQAIPGGCTIKWW